MNPDELAMNRGLREVRNYGVAILVALLALNGVVLGTVHWIETNDLKNELVTYMGTIPTPDKVTPDQVVHLPEEILSFKMKTLEHAGFYERSMGEHDYLAYADKDKHYVLMKSEAMIQKETLSFAIALGALYAGELVLLVGWWFFIRSKVREIFEAA